MTRVIPRGLLRSWFWQGWFGGWGIVGTLGATCLSTHPERVNKDEQTRAHGGRPSGQSACSYVLRPLSKQASKAKPSPSQARPGQASPRPRPRPTTPRHATPRHATLRLCHVKPSQAKPRKAKQSQAKPSKAKQAKPSKQASKRDWRSCEDKFSPSAGARQHNVVSVPCAVGKVTHVYRSLYARSQPL